MAKAEPLEMDRVAVGLLPPVGLGGNVWLVDLCEGETLRKLQGPHVSLLLADEMPVAIPQPQVRAKDVAEWEALAVALHEQSILTPAESPLCLGDKPVFEWHVRTCQMAELVRGQ